MVEPTGSPLPDPSAIDVSPGNRRPHPNQPHVGSPQLPLSPPSPSSPYFSTTNTTTTTTAPSQVQLPSQQTESEHHQQQKEEEGEPDRPTASPSPHPPPLRYHSDNSDSCSTCSSLEDPEPEPEQDVVHVSRMVVSRSDPMRQGRFLGQRIWFVQDICGIVCASFTYWLMIFSQYVVLTCILLPEEELWYKVLNLIIFEGLSVLAITSHLRTMCTDPGSVPRGTATKEAIEQLGLTEGQVLYKCQKCCSIKPERAHHCSVCNRCIRKMDHHCPWVNNCVGEGNQKYFVLFTMYIATLSVHALIMSVLHFMKCIDNDWKKCPSIWGQHDRLESPTPWTIILLVCLVFEALLFSIFTLIMFGMQVQAIWYDETGIEHLKKENITSRRRSWKSFRHVFGRGFSLSWFSPFTRPMIMGECESKFTYSV